MAYVSEKGLGDLKEKGRKMFLPGVKGRNIYFQRNAFLLGRYALKKKEEDQGQSVVAILFRDCDGTRSSPRSEWDDKRNSIVYGFEKAGLRTGVAMVPKTKSECWLLCAVQEDSYRDCGRFEELSGNDSSEKGAPKKVLQKTLGEEGTSELLRDLIHNGTIDPIRIDMPSFNVFKKDLEEAIRVAMKE
ncbi:hypothetical protein SAMN06275492_1082 [Dethiosulfovibrio salsuginis]|uniref:Uncharacterized protein n=1 Tax=Dethiosulfovibrio salsuginis TaxID=561720 RepID=A0A1X7J446_9BACT|nr:hypothetical protein SAMN06275492_1082 [Dethiosulfovibrio salsuginis]